MKWYITRMIFQITSGKGDHAPQFDNQFRVIRAYNEKHAYEVSRSIGKAEEETYINRENEAVTWKFTGIGDLTELSESAYGKEIFSTLSEPDDASVYQQMIRDRESMIRERFILLPVAS